MPNLGISTYVKKIVIIGKEPKRFYISYKVSSSYSNFFRSGSTLTWGVFTTSDISSLEFFNLALNDSIAQIFFFLQHEGSCKCTRKDQKSRILPSTIVNNEYLRKLSNTGQMWIGISLE